MGEHAKLRGRRLGGLLVALVLATALLTACSHIGGGKYFLY